MSGDAEATRKAVHRFSKVAAVFGDSILLCALAYAQTEEGRAILERCDLSISFDHAKPSGLSAIGEERSD